MMTIRQLEDADFDRLHEIDLSEHITLIYKLDNGQLLPEAHDWQRPRGDAPYWQHQVAEWRRTLKPDVWLGAFMSDQLVGLASLRYHLAPDLAQLTTLHVSQPHRRQGVARRLLDTVIELSQQSGAQFLYVSATPSASAVGFYQGQGFMVTTEPNPEMVALEPDDIHMVRPLSSA
jgi:ribosomal protein S18 acetylase RimI-like enzyme